MTADTDPAGLMPGQNHPGVDLERYGLTIWDLDRSFWTGGLSGREHMPLREIIALMRRVYCGKVGIEYRFISNPVEKEWIDRDRVVARWRFIIVRREHCHVVQEHSCLADVAAADDEAGSLVPVLHARSRLHGARGAPPGARRGDDVDGGAPGAAPASPGWPRVCAAGSSTVPAAPPGTVPQRIAPAVRRCLVSALVSTPAIPTMPCRSISAGSEVVDRQLDGAGDTSRTT